MFGQNRVAKGIDDLWSSVVFFSWYFPISMSLPFRYYLHFIYKYEHGIMISRNAITNVDFLCKSSETQETLALALFIPSAQS